MEKLYINSVLKQLTHFKNLAYLTFERLTDEELNWQFSKETNSIATIAKHISGNMLSRWTNIFTEDGEKIWRQREKEFEHEYISKESLVSIWEKGWNCFFEAINPLSEKDLERIIYIRNEKHTVVDAINRQMAHYPYHIGQIVLIGIQIKGANWQSLSIPKGESKIFNDEKFKINKSKQDIND